jgi:DNA-binding NarL/FixJ family response regulator
LEAVARLSIARFRSGTIGSRVVPDYRQQRRSQEGAKMHKIILADNQAIFRVGTAKVLATQDDLRIIAQCPDYPRLYIALNTFRGSIVIVASSMRPDLKQVIAGARSAASRLILIQENGDLYSSTILTKLHGLIFRNVSKTELLGTVRQVIQGGRSIHPLGVSKDAEPEDFVGARVRDRLTPKEMKIVALIVQGFKNKEIGLRLRTTEQGIKNCLRSVYDKTGVSDRLELALFTIHHPTLAEAATAVGELFELGARNVDGISTAMVA